jgi:hypothetical protein
MVTTKPLPWHDTPKCHDVKCGGPVVSALELKPGYYCGACGSMFRPNEAEKAQIERAEEAWERVLAGEVHETKVCARCGGCLPVTQHRLCPPCVEKDNAEKQSVLF